MRIRRPGQVVQRNADLRPTKSVVISRVYASVIEAWGYAAAFFLVSGTLYVLTGGNNVRWPLMNILIVYAGGATLAGILAGLLQPWGTTTPRKWIVGVIAAWPACWFGFLIFAQTDTLDSIDYLFITVAAVVYSSVFTFWSKDGSASE
jgi:hypothetical protein